MGRVWGSDEHGKPLTDFVNVPELSPFPHEWRYYGPQDVIRTRTLAALKFRKDGYDYIVMELGEDDMRLVDIRMLQV